MSLRRTFSDIHSFLICFGEVDCSVCVLSGMDFVSVELVASKDLILGFEAWTK